MSYMNITYHRMGYSDPNSSNNPRERIFDVHTEFSGLTLNNPVSYEKLIEPEETVQLESTLRTLGYDGTTEFQILKSFLDSDEVTLRYTGTGTAPGFRTRRSISGGVDTEITVDKISDTAVKFTVINGTSFDFSSVQLRDSLYLSRTDSLFTSPFNSSVTGTEFDIVDKGSDYIIIRDPSRLWYQGSTGIIIGNDFDWAFRIFSSSGVQPGDRLRFSPTANMKLDNKERTYRVVSVTDAEVTFMNSNFISETTIPGINTIEIFDRLLNFISLESSNNAVLTLGNNNVQIYVTRFSDTSALFVGTVEASKLLVYNPNSEAILVKAQIGTFTE